MSLTAFGWLGPADQRRLLFIAVIQQPLAARPLTEPAPSRLALDTPGRDEIIGAHADAVARNEAGYIDPTSGLFVLSASFLADRAYCCGRGCRHCPYIED
ncbi:MAG TPA: DUF5522 domain-containing protein [Mycobacteriales bacterium]|nr:DUF5522 domain-containing protein [Mycobacteriales bacterium]HWA66466.1 DUF5522 domain-containing protein [Mycobacteriales bacterium]